MSGLETRRRPQRHQKQIPAIANFIDCLSEDPETISDLDQLGCEDTDDRLQHVFGLKFFLPGHLFNSETEHAIPKAVVEHNETWRQQLGAAAWWWAWRRQ